MAKIEKIIIVLVVFVIAVGVLFGNNVLGDEQVYVVDILGYIEGLGNYFRTLWNDVIMEHPIVVAFREIKEVDTIDDFFKLFPKIGNAFYDWFNAIGEVLFGIFDWIEGSFYSIKLNKAPYGG